MRRPCLGGIGRRAAAGIAVAALLATGPGAGPAAGGGSVGLAGAGPGVPGRPGVVEAPVPAALPQPAGTTSLVSVRFGGGFPGGGSRMAAISSSGRYVAFASGAADLVAGDANGAVDVFVRDRLNGTTILLPLPGGRTVPSGGQAYEPSISANGSVVAFTYLSPSLAAAGQQVVMAWDRRTGNTQIVSRSLRGTAGGSHAPSVSGDGRYVAYTSDNGIIVTNDNNEAEDVFRYDRTTQTSALVSVGVGGDAAGGREPSIDGDGSVVAFTSDGGDTIVPQNTGRGAQVYVRDMNAGRTTLVSLTADSQPASGPAQAPSISDDGHVVAFASSAGNMVPEALQAPAQVYRRDLQAGTLDLVSVAKDGSAAPAVSGMPAISRDGRMVAFISLSANLVAAAPGFRLVAVSRIQTEVYLRDVVAKQTALISVTTSGRPAGAGSLEPSVGGNGRFVAFASDSPALVRGDDNQASDVFVRDLPPAPRLNPAVVDFGTRAVGAPVTSAAGILFNAGWGPLAVSGATVAGAQAADFRVQVDGCAGKVLYRGEACTVTLGFTPSARGTRTATLRVADGFTGSPRTARLTGRASQALIKLDPPVGPQGIVTVASGSGFPPGARVRLSWSVGITPRLPVVTVDANGRFKIQVLVFHNDRIGPRDLVAQSAGGSPFPTLSVTMLVGVRSMAPPGFLTSGRAFDLPLMLMFRG